MTTIVKRYQGHRIYCSHTEWEANNPLDREYAQSVTDGLQQRGLGADREYPCSGLLRDIDPTFEFVVLCCDTCFFETSFRRARAAVDPDERIESATKREEPGPF